MMNLFYSQVKDSVSYALSDKKAVLLIGILVVVNSILRKDDYLNPIWSVFNITVFFFIGYGSFISWYALKGQDKHPDIKNYKRLFWEGFKKATITAIYSIGLTFFSYHAKLNIADGNMLLAAICIILFIIIYLFLIAGLLNRYINRGKFLKAFDFVEIIMLLMFFDLTSFIKVLVAVVISQAFAVLVVAGFNQGFTLFELAYSIAAFFLAPFTYFATKRFVGLNVRELLKDVERK